MKILIPLDLRNYNDFNYFGKRIVYEQGFAEVVVDSSKTNDLKVGGLRGPSLKDLLQSHKEVYLVSEI